jgi:hypothetical protein
LNGELTNVSGIVSVFVIRLFAESKASNICIWFALFLSLQERELECQYQPLSLSPYFLKDKVKTIPMRATKVFRGMEVPLHSFFTPIRWR